MKFIFFLNCVSPHLMPMISRLPDLPEVDGVTVCAPVIDYAYRRNMGWSGADYMTDMQVRFLIAPIDEQVHTLFEEHAREGICFFNGISGFPEILHWLRLSLGYDLRRGVIQEGPNLYEHPLWQHALRFALKDWRYVRHIDWFLTMGDRFVPYYKMWSCRWRVHPFMYVTESPFETGISPREAVGDPSASAATPESGGALRLLFVGELSDRKNPGLLLDALDRLTAGQRAEVSLTFAGDGPLRSALEGRGATLLGRQPMEEVPRLMQQHDVLVLPSRHDGWGAVVNEALMLGLYVICSDGCGARSLLDEAQQGAVFDRKSADGLAAALRECLNRKIWLRESRTARRQWAQEHISGRVQAEKLLQICLG